LLKLCSGTSAGKFDLSVAADAGLEAGVGKLDGLCHAISGNGRAGERAKRRDERGSGVDLHSLVIPSG
jgi:hypothetical protein